MNEQQFVAKMIELMDTEEKLTMDSDLVGLEEWDSLSYVSFLALCRTYSKNRVLPADVKKAQTVRDLYKLFTGGK